MSGTEGVGRRGFLKGAAAGAAGFVAPPGASAQSSPPAQPAAAADNYHVDRPGADFMVDVLKSLGFDFCIANPASSFRGLHESLINYGGNTSPEWLTCTHEQAAVNIANGYYAVAGKPAAVVMHIRSIRSAPHLRMEKANWRPGCHRCNAIEAANERRIMKET